MVQEAGFISKERASNIIAKELGCDEFQFEEMNTANTRGIDTIRAVIDAAQYPPLLGGIKVYLFDEAHKTVGDDNSFSFAIYDKNISASEYRKNWAKPQCFIDQ
jgi:hypothetical protein